MCDRLLPGGLGMLLDVFDGATLLGLLRNQEFMNMHARVCFHCTGGREDFSMDTRAQTLPAPSTKPRGREVLLLPVEREKTPKFQKYHHFKVPPNLLPKGGHRALRRQFEEAQAKAELDAAKKREAALVLPVIETAKTIANGQRRREEQPPLVCNEYNNMQSQSHSNSGAALPQLAQIPAHYAAWDL